MEVHGCSSTIREIDEVDSVDEVVTCNITGIYANSRDLCKLSGFMLIYVAN